MRYVVTADEMRALDATTIEELGLPGAVLMENAGRRVAHVILECMRERDMEHGHVAIVCGAGNNGGDGYVVGRYLRDHDIDATVFLCADAARLTGDARLHFDVYCAMGHPVVDISSARALAEKSSLLETSAVVVDSVFGTGLSRELDGHYLAVVRAINACPGVRVAVDIPSGMYADTGHSLGDAVNADITVTMAFLKVGLASAPGVARCGQVHVAEIGIPERLALQSGVSVGLMEASDVASLMPALGSLDHKNRRGHLLAVAGSPGKRGAARLLAWAALRTGAGLVTVASPWRGSEPDMPDPVMTAELEPGLGPDRTHARLLELSSGKRALAMGPGMLTEKGGRDLVLSALSALEMPMVLDADALNHIGTDLGRVRDSRASVVLTPHPGEAARLCDTSTAGIQRDRLDAVRKLAEATGAVVVLKGARSLVCCGIEGPRQGMVAINPTGNAGLATAGSGDVLTGIIGAFLAQGVDAFDAACLGVYIHGRTGDMTARALGTRHAVTAADLSEHIPGAMAELADT